MKLFILYFICCCSTLYSQNYQYSLDTSSSTNKGLEKGNAKNQPEEDMYFNAYLLPIERAFELQKVLDKYKTVRLERGSYPGIPIVLKSGQQLIGHPSITKLNVPITIQAGSSKIRLQNINPKTIKFEAGAPITGNVFKSLQYTFLNCKDCTLENNSFINMDKCIVRFDCSNSGYFRNNKFVKLWSHTRSMQTVMKGNTATPSYGNVVLWRNYLIPKGDATDFEQLESMTIVGIDAESWNFQNQGTKPLLYMRNMGNVKIGSFSGLNHGKNPTPVFDIEADNLWMMGKNIYSKSKKDIIRPGTNLLMLSGKHEEYTHEDNSSLNLMAYFKNKEVMLNNKKLTSKASKGDQNTLKNLLMKEDVKTWERPYFHKVPNPVSADQMAARSKKKDQSAMIQAMIDRDGIAELEEGIYYIAKSLHIEVGQGIIGKGSGKTAVVGMTDDFPLIRASDDLTKKGKTSARYYLAHMTLQGGSEGFLVSPLGREKNRLQISSCTFKHLNFRNQKNGMHFDQFYGVDNNFFDNVNFIDCKIGILQTPDPTFDVHKGETTTMMYMDKNVFYKCQIIRCGVGFSLLSRRPNMLNAWIDCNFDSNGISVDMENSTNPIFANCNFKNSKGEYIIGREKSGSFYNCDFTNNSVISVFKLQNAYIEGSRFYGTARMFSKWPNTGFIANSMIQGSLGTMKNGVLINNSFTRIPSLNYYMVEMKDGKTTRMMDQKSNPKPQFLVWQK
ncbi:hypothetical protein LCGC14_0945100 [marine sediment metagenome]|uniref:Right handed beta helix domain-containing protein n=1 Tax=marine sediment metagenome TaxID=412755 RepID=A0A0F9R2H2_9ZZZZ